MDGQETCETVKIVDEKGVEFVINKSAFDPKKHKLAKGEKVEPTGKKDGDGDDNKIAKAPEGQLTIAKNGKSGRGSKFIIINDKGEKVGEDEFDNEGEAFAALATLQAAQAPAGNTEGA